MVSIHRVSIAVILIISIVCFIFRFKRGAVCHALIGGPRKTRTNSMEITVHAIYAQNHHAVLVCSIENFLGFQLTREHNASNSPKCLRYSIGHTCCKFTQSFDMNKHCVLIFYYISRRMTTESDCTSITRICGFVFVSITPILLLKTFSAVFL